MEAGGGTAMSLWGPTMLFGSSADEGDEDRSECVSTVTLLDGEDESAMALVLVMLDTFRGLRSHLLTTANFMFYGTFQF
jgi:hypothetical protein